MRLPFQGEDNLSVALMHLHQPPIPPREINEKIPESLNRIVLKALSKQKERRYRSIREKQADLQRALRHPDGKYVRILEEELPSAPEDRMAQKRAGRHAVLAAACLSVAFVAIIFAFFAIFRTINRSEETILDEQGIANVTVQYVDLPEQEAGIVVGQSPDAETRVLEGESVTIIVNRPQQNNAPAQAGNAQQAPQA